jgi:NAD(P)-dependent dehydrogenase (short-subunit alcohol dehydrogenase family)/pimeloyl-ACP methyl ester carboxylesterase
MTTTANVSGVRERTVLNGKIDIAVYEEGDPDGETIVLVHGWPDSHRLWDGVVPLLADRFHVVSYDTRGHGKTTNPGKTADFRIAELATDFRAVADAVSPDKPVHVLAHDWGSVTVWEAICEPGAEERVASFTSVSGPNVDHFAKWARDRLSRPTPRNVGQPLSQLLHYSYMLFFATPILPKVAFRLAASKRTWKAFLARQEGTPAEQVHLADTFRDDIVNGLRIYRANALGALRGARERYTDVPVQLIVNTRDLAVRPPGFADTARWTGRFWRRDISAGHWSPFSHPQVLADATAELIDALAGKPAARALLRAESAAAGGSGDAGEFAHQLVVVTGAGSGIGRETALAFARSGAEVVVSDIDETSAKATAAMIVEAGGVADAYQLDVSDETAVTAFADTVTDTHGVPDVLVNNAGVGHAGEFLDTPSEQFQRVMDINFNGVVYGCRAFAGRMVQRGIGGHIVNLSSMAAYTPQRGMGPYASSKSAVFMFSDCLRAELEPAGIGVTTVCPGIVHTNITATTTFSGTSAEEQARKQAKADRLYRMRRYTPDKVAQQILKGVKHNKAVLPVTPEAAVGYRTSRLAPALTRRMARSSLIDRL